jgi:hypothetical protein
MSTATSLLIQHAPTAIALALFIAALIVLWRERKAGKDHELL